MRRALKLTAAFGGANAAVAYAAAGTRCDSEEEGATTRHAPVVLKSVAVLAPRGLAATSAEIADRERQFGPIEGFRFTDVVPSIDPRRLDRSSRHLIAVTSVCAERAALRLRGDMKDRAGLFVAATRMPEESARKCKDSVRYNGVAGTSAAAFAHMSVNAPTGACAKALALRGPSTTISIGEGSGLLTVVLAADCLARRRDADWVFAGAVDEVNASGSDTEAAACALLARHDVADSGSGDVHVLGWGISGPAAGDQAIRQAVGDEEAPDLLVSDGDCGAEYARAFPGRSEPSRIDISSFWGRAEGTRSAVALAVAVAELVERRTERVLVVGARSRSAACALLLARAPRGSSVRQA